MREIVSLNIGQAGVQLANAAWELFCIEQGIRCDGTSVTDFNEEEEAGCSVFFHPLERSKVPRTLSVDFEPTVIDEVRTGAYRHLFHPDCLISGGEDCANNFARGSYSIGKIYMGVVMKQVRKLVEACDSLQGFCLLNSYDGGTGAGFSSSLLEDLTQHYSKRPKFQLGIYPSRKMASSIVYPYNAVMHTHTTMVHADLTALMDNEAIYSICANKLNLHKPTFTHINRIVAQLYSSMTVSMRYQTQINSDIDQLCTNLVPYPRIHFPLSHLAPLLSIANSDKEVSNVLDLTRDIFDKQNQLVDCCAQDGLFMACVLQFRGLMAPTEVNKAICEIKRRTDVRFVEWSPTGFKIGISNKPSAVTPGSPLAQVQQSLSMLSNSTAVVDVWSQLLMKFNSLFAHRAFLHWFVGEGMEEGELIESYNKIKLLERDYIEISEPYEEWFQETGGSKSYDYPKTSSLRKQNNNDKSQKASGYESGNLTDPEEYYDDFSTLTTEGKMSSKKSERGNISPISKSMKKDRGKSSKTEKNSQLDKFSKSEKNSKTERDFINESIFNKGPSTNKNPEISQPQVSFRSNKTSSVERLPGETYVNRPFKQGIPSFKDSVKNSNEGDPAVFLNPIGAPHYSNYSGQLSNMDKDKPDLLELQNSSGVSL